MPTKSEEGLSGLLNKKYSKGPESLIASYGNVEENEKTNAAIADDDGRSILTQHTVKVGTESILTTDPFIHNGKRNIFVPPLHL